VLAPAHEHGPRPSRPGGGSLDARIRALAWQAERSGLADYVSIYVARAVSGSQPIAEYRSDEDFPAASVIKVPVMLAVEQSWSEHPKRRTRARIELLEQMMRKSDNEAANALIRDLGGFDAVNAETCEVLGVAHTTTRLASYLRSVGGGSRNPKNRACPSEVGELLSTISEREDRGDSQAREMLEIMRRASAEHRTRIPQGVPPEYRDLVANKTGTLMSYRVTNDAAIVETPDGSRYVLCVFMEGVHRVEAADVFCTEVSHLCWISLSGPDLTAASTPARPRREPTRRAARGSERKGKPKPIAAGPSKNRSRPAEASAGIARRLPASEGSGPPPGKRAAAGGPKLEVTIEPEVSSGDQ
jgi:beta-lactamase class A